MNLDDIKLAKEDTNIFSEKECHHLNCIYIFLEKLDKVWNLPVVIEEAVNSIHFDLIPALYADIDDFTFQDLGFYLTSSDLTSGNNSFRNYDHCKEEVKKLELTKSLQELDTESMPFNGNLELFQFILKKDTTIEDILTENLLNKNMFEKLLKSVEINQLKADLNKEEIKSNRKNKI